MNQNNRIAEAMLSTDEAIPRTKMLGVQALFDDNPDDGFIISEIMGITGLSRSSVDTKIVALRLDLYIESVGKRRVSKNVHRTIYRKTKITARNIINGPWAKESTCL